MEVATSTGHNCRLVPEANGPCHSQVMRGVHSPERKRARHSSSGAPTQVQHQHGVRDHRARPAEHECMQPDSNPAAASPSTSGPCGQHQLQHHNKQRGKQYNQNHQHRNSSPGRQRSGRAAAMAMPNGRTAWAVPEGARCNRAPVHSPTSGSRSSSPAHQQHVQVQTAAGTRHTSPSPLLQWDRRDKRHPSPYQLRHTHDTPPGHREHRQPNTRDAGRQYIAPSDSMGDGGGQDRPSDGLAQHGRDASAARQQSAGNDDKQRASQSRGQANATDHAHYSIPVRRGAPVPHAINLPVPRARAGGPHTDGRPQSPPDMRTPMSACARPIHVQAGMQAGRLEVHGLPRSSAPRSATTFVTGLLGMYGVWVERAAAMPRDCGRPECAADAAAATHLCVSLSLEQGADTQRAMSVLSVVQLPPPPPASAVAERLQRRSSRDLATSANAGEDVANARAGGGGSKRAVHATGRLQRSVSRVSLASGQGMGATDKEMDARRSSTPEEHRHTHAVTPSPCLTPSARSPCAGSSPCAPPPRSCMTLEYAHATSDGAQVVAVERGRGTAPPFSLDAARGASKQRARGPVRMQHRSLSPASHSHGSSRSRSRSRSRGRSRSPLQARAGSSEPPGLAPASSSFWGRPAVATAAAAPAPRPPRRVSSTPHLPLAPKPKASSEKAAGRAAGQPAASGQATATARPPIFAMSFFRHQPPAAAPAVPAVTAAAAAAAAAAVAAAAAAGPATSPVIGPAASSWSSGRPTAVSVVQVSAHQPGSVQNSHSHGSRCDGGSSESSRQRGVGAQQEAAVPGDAVCTAVRRDIVADGSGHTQEMRGDSCAPALQSVAAAAEQMAVQGNADGAAPPTPAHAHGNQGAADASDSTPAATSVAVEVEVAKVCASEPCAAAGPAPAHQEVLEMQPDHPPNEACAGASELDRAASAVSEPGADGSTPTAVPPVVAHEPAVLHTLHSSTNALLHAQHQGSAQTCFHSGDSCDMVHVQGTTTHSPCPIHSAAAMGVQQPEAITHIPYLAGPATGQRLGPGSWIAQGQMPHTMQALLSPQPQPIIAAAQEEAKQLMQYSQQQQQQQQQQHDSEQRQRQTAQDEVAAGAALGDDEDIFEEMLQEMLRLDAPGVLDTQSPLATATPAAAPTAPRFASITGPHAHGLVSLAVPAPMGSAPMVSTQGQPLHLAPLRVAHGTRSAAHHTTAASTPPMQRGAVLGPPLQLPPLSLLSDSPAAIVTPTGRPVRSFAAATANGSHPDLSSLVPLAQLRASSMSDPGCRIPARGSHASDTGGPHVSAGGLLDGDVSAQSGHGPDAATNATAALQQIVLPRDCLVRLARSGRLRADAPGFFVRTLAPGIYSQMVQSAAGHAPTPARVWYEVGQVECATVTHDAAGMPLVMLLVVLPDGARRGIRLEELSNEAPQAQELAGWLSYGHALPAGALAALAARRRDLGA